MANVILVRSDVMHGEPCFAGTRVAVQTLFDWLEEGHDITYFLEQFPSVTHDQVIAVLETARRHTLGEAMAGRWSSSSMRICRTNCGMR